MNVFLKIIAGVFTAVILWLCISKDNKPISTLLSLSVCVMVITASLGFLKPIVNFIYQLQVLGHLNTELFTVVLKVVGIGILTELSVVICKDAGNEAMVKSLQILSTVVIIRISIPVFETLISLIDNILGTI